MRLFDSAVQTKFHSYSAAKFHKYVFDGVGENPRLWKHLSPAASQCAVDCTTTTLLHRLPGTKSLPEQDVRTLMCVRTWLQRDFILTGPCPQQSWLASKTIGSVSSSEISNPTVKMFRLPYFLLALAATGLAAVPEGYRKVIIPTKVNTNYVVVPSTATNGSMLVV